jgi:hypothetical protein
LPLDGPDSMMAPRQRAINPQTVKENSMNASISPRALWPFHVGAAADVAVGIGLVALAPQVAGLILPAHSEVAGLATAGILRGLGIFLILFAIETVIVARAQGALARFRSWVVAANWATVALVVVLLATVSPAFSAIGIAAVAAIGLFVAGITFLQQKAI